MPKYMEGEIPPYNNRHQIQIFEKPYGYSCYIGDLYDDVDFYESMFDCLDSLSEHDRFTIFLNSGGGSVDVAVAIRNALMSSKATTESIIQSTAHSAGSMLALSTDIISVMPNTFMLIHYYSGGYMGKGSDIENAVVSNKKYFKQLMEDIYTGFLTPKEMATVLKGEELWLMDYEIIEKVKSFSEYKINCQSEIESENRQEHEARLVASLMESGKYKIEKVNAQD